MKKKNKLSEAGQIALEKVSICENRIKALHYAVEGSRGKSSYKAYENDFSKLHCFLYDELNEAYRVLFMWGTLIGGEYLEKSKKAALDHYLKKDSSIMEYLDIHGSFECSLEEKFRKEIELLRKQNKDNKNE